MVTVVTKQRYLINFTFFETFKDEPIPHKNFTFLGEGSYEITGGGVGPTPLGVRCGFKTLGIRSVKVIHFTSLSFVSNNCFEDHKITKSVTDRLISISCIPVTSGITCLVLITSQIKDIVLFNNL